MDSVVTRSAFADETVQSLIELGRCLAGPQFAAGSNIPYVIVDNEVKLLPELIYNEHSPTPERIRSKVDVFDQASFAAYYRRFADEGTRVFADEAARKVVAIFDYHSDSTSPRWGQHRATLVLRESDEWKIWAGANNKQMTQQAFAEFLEQNAMDITTPTPAAMMEVARDLEATTESEFGSGLRMSDGQVKFRYSETVKARVGGGEVSVPEQFGLGIPVFVGGYPAPVSALLRFRVKEGKLTFWYTLIRPESVLRAAFIAARDGITAQLAIEIINGVVA